MSNRVSLKITSRRRIVKTVATKCEILRLKCTKIDFSWGSAPDPIGELTALPRRLAAFKKPTSKGRGGERWEGERKGRRRGEGKKGDGGRERDPVCIFKFSLE